MPGLDTVSTISFSLLSEQGSQFSSQLHMVARDQAEERDLAIAEATEAVCSKPLGHCGILLNLDHSGP